MAEWSGCQAVTDKMSGCHCHGKGLGLKLSICLALLPVAKTIYLYGLMLQCCPALMHGAFHTKKKRKKWKRKRKGKKLMP